MASWLVARVALVAALALACSLPPPVSAQTGIHLNCTTGRGGMMHTCTVSDWRLAARSADQVQGGINFTINPPSNVHRVRLQVACGGNNLQTFALVPQSGHVDCNATVNPFGQVYKNSGTPGPNEIEPASCFYSSPEVTMSRPDLMYSNNLNDMYYAIGTMGMASAANQFVAVNNKTGGACLSGLRASISINWKPPSTSTATSPPNGTTADGHVKHDLGASRKGSGRAVVPAAALTLCMLVVWQVVGGSWM